MADSTNPNEEAKPLKIANGPDPEELLEKLGIPSKAPAAAPHVPVEGDVAITAPQSDLIEPALEPKEPKPSKIPKPVSALNLLEKLAAKQTNDELKKQTKELLAQLELSPFEMAIAQHLDVADGEIDRSQFVLEAFASKKLLAYALKVEPPLLSTETLLDMWLNPKFKAVRSAVEKALKNVKTVSPSELDSEAIAKLRSLLRTQDEKIISAWLENLILPLQVKMSSSDGAALLENLYGKFDPKKGASAGLRDLLATSIEWLAQSQNLAQLDQAITDASGLSAGPYARIVHATRKMPFKVGSARYSFVVSLLKSRERKTVTFLAQTGIFDDFTLDGIGLLAANEETFAHISSNETVLGAIKDECRRRLKSEDIAKVHYWLLKYPNVRQWLTDAQLLQRLRPQDDYLSRLLFEEGRRVGELEASERSEVEVTGLKDEIRASDLEKKKLTAELESLSERFAELEQRLRNAANSAQGAKDDQIRQAQIDSVKVLIEFMNSIEISTSIDGGTRSSLEATRAKLKSFGVAWRHEIGSIVPFTAQDHLSSGLQDGAMVQILTPCYYLQNTPTKIALVKARVLPQ